MFLVPAKYLTFEDSSTYAVTSESVLLGHENWVTDLHWSPPTMPERKLLSASADRSLIIWEHSNSSSIWLNQTRFGELGGVAGLGFFGALWGKNGNEVLAHDWTGSFHRWTSENQKWTAAVGIRGHWREVRGIEWQRNGHWLMTTR